MSAVLTVASAATFAAPRAVVMAPVTAAGLRVGWSAIGDQALDAAIDLLQLLRTWHTRSVRG